MALFHCGCTAQLLATTGAYELLARSALVSWCTLHAAATEGGGQHFMPLPLEGAGSITGRLGPPSAALPAAATGVAGAVR